MVEIKLMKFGDTSPATEQLQHHCELEEVAVLNVGDGIARIYGLNNVQSGDSWIRCRRCEGHRFEPGKTMWV